MGILEVEQLCVRKRCEVWLETAERVPTLRAVKESRNWEVRG